MKKTTLLASMTASAALMIGAAACGSTKAAEKPAEDAAAAPTDAAKPADGHCGAEKGDHEGSCGAPATGDVPPPADAPK